MIETVIMGRTSFVNWAHLHVIHECRPKCILYLPNRAERPERRDVTITSPEARRALCPGQRLYSNRRRYIMNNIVEDELDLMGYDDRRYGPGF